MSSQSINKKIALLRAQMEEAAEREDFELAARLRNELKALEPSTVQKPVPGAMGLGTHLPVAEPPKGWVKPKKPDLLVGRNRRKPQR